MMMMMMMMIMIIIIIIIITTSNPSLYDCHPSPFQAGYLLTFCPQIMDKRNEFKYKPAYRKGGACPPTGAQHGLTST